MAEYRVEVGKQGICLGHTIEIATDGGAVLTSALTQSMDGSYDWDLPSGVYTAREIVHGLNILLKAVLAQLGPATDPQTFIAGIGATLSLSAQESALPLDALSVEHTSSIVFRDQAKRISDRLCLWLAQDLEQSRAASEYDNEVLTRLQVRSRCDGYRWTQPVTALLTGSEGGPIVMQLFNEYTHQMVLLRNALLPFLNWEEVPVEIEPGRSAKGLRFLEEINELFISKLMAKKISHKLIVQLAQKFLAPSLKSLGYGFQYSLGLVLPANLGHPFATDTKYLLLWHRANLVEADSQAPIAFSYGFEDYYLAPRSSLPSEPALEQPTFDLESDYQASILVRETHGETATLDYSLQNASEQYRVDLGQCFRGQRYVYHAQAVEAELGSKPFSDHTSIIHHSISEIVNQAGLVTSAKGVHAISTRGDRLALWALLGKIYPENVILRPSSDQALLDTSDTIGKGFGAKFLLD